MLAIFTSPAAQALLGAAVSYAVKVIQGEDPDEALMALQAAAVAHKAAHAEWEQAKRDNPV